MTVIEFPTWRKSRKTLRSEGMIRNSPSWRRHWFQHGMEDYGMHPADILTFGFVAVLGVTAWTLWAFVE